ncbi:hypothetical protein C4J81_16940 [Deltaproteobacteria bacterium Smac51]|nr:hypothetical protein C4J81_16940 [Deltaproteobacteria bacterium Smac51]
MLSHTDMEKFKAVAEAIHLAGGRLFLVGGRVRDCLLGAETDNHEPDTLKDSDLVVLGLPLKEILAALAPFGAARAVGRRTSMEREKEDSIAHLSLPPDLLEVSPARRLNGSEAEFSSEASLMDDAIARDFTVNAVYFDPLTERLEDPLGGVPDAERRNLRLCGARALEMDPVRVMRAMVLVSRFEFTAQMDFLAATEAAAGLLKTVPPERLWPEWRKWCLSAKPHLGLDFMKDSGLLNFWPDLAELPKTPQNERFHPEGDAWVHTVMVVKAMRELELPEGADRQVLTLAALLHDIAKPVVTQMVDGKWVSRGHAQAGPPLALNFLESIKTPPKIIRPVLKLVERHMDLAFQIVSPKALRRLARRLSPECDLIDFWAIAAADWNGRGPEMGRFPMSLQEFLAPLGGRADSPPPLLMGRDLIGHFGLPPGPEIGRLLRLIEEASDEGIITTKEAALEYAAGLISAR